MPALTLAGLATTLIVTLPAQICPAIFLRRSTRTQEMLTVTNRNELARTALRRTAARRHGLERKTRELFGHEYLRASIGDP